MREYFREWKESVTPMETPNWTPEDSGRSTPEETTRPSAWVGMVSALEEQSCLLERVCVRLQTLEDQLAKLFGNIARLEAKGQDEATIKELAERKEHAAKLRKKHLVADRSLLQGRSVGSRG